MNIPLGMWIVFTLAVGITGFMINGWVGVLLAIPTTIVLFFVWGFMGQRRIKKKGLMPDEWKLQISTRFYNIHKKLADDANPHARMLGNDKYDDQMTLLIIMQDIEKMYQGSYFAATRKGEEWNTKHSFGRSAAKIINEEGKDTPRGKYLLELGGFIIDEEYQAGSSKWKK